MKYLQKFNEALIDKEFNKKLIAFCEEHLSYLMDNIDLEIEIDLKYSTRSNSDGILLDLNFTGHEDFVYLSDIKDSLIPFFIVLMDNYELATFSPTKFHNTKPDSILYVYYIDEKSLDKKVAFYTEKDILSGRLKDCMVNIISILIKGNK